jgi:hypothetical protein
MLNSITVRATVFILGMLGVVGAITVALYALTPAVDRPAFGAHLLDAIPAVVAAVPAVLAMLFAKDARQSSANNEKALNGELDERMAGIIHATLDERENPTV